MAKKKKKKERPDSYCTGNSTTMADLPYGTMMGIMTTLSMSEINGFVTFLGGEPLDSKNKGVIYLLNHPDLKNIRMDFEIRVTRKKLKKCSK